MVKTEIIGFLEEELIQRYETFRLMNGGGKMRAVRFEGFSPGNL